MDNERTPGALGSNAELGPLPERPAVAYLYHDAQSARDVDPLIHSAVLTFYRQPHYRNETPLVPLADAQAMVAAERERCATWLEMADGNRDQREHAAKLAALLRKA